MINCNDNLIDFDLKQIQNGLIKKDFTTTRQKRNGIINEILKSLNRKLGSSPALGRPFYDRLSGIMASADCSG